MPHQPFSNEDYELDSAIRTLEDAEEIRKDLKLMGRIENRLQEKQVDLGKIEEQLFGKSSGSNNKQETKEVG